jgi:hypothetical protein
MCDLADCSVILHAENLPSRILVDSSLCDVKMQVAWANRQMLHASSIQILHPLSSERVTFKAPLPHDFLSALAQASIDLTELHHQADEIAGKHL